MRKLSTLWKHFVAAQKGNVGIIFALSVVPIVAGAGVAIDFGRFHMINTKLQASLDAASLAAATAAGVTDSEREKIAQDLFAADSNGGDLYGAPAKAKFTVDGVTVKGEAHATMSPTFLAVVGVGDTDIGAQNAVGILAERKAEIAMVLDYSGSMGEYAGGQIKYQAMGQAATKLIDDLSVKDPSKVKIALVPFSQHVYGTLNSNHVKGATGSSWTGCTQDRLSPYNLTDATPNPADDSTKWGQPMVKHPWASSCSDYANQSLVMRPLTDDFSGLKSQIAAMKPYQNTHIALGAEFGYQMLSPNGAFTGAVPYTDKTTSKFLVLLTDGVQTEPAWGPGGARNVPQGDANLEQLCENIKASGITIVTLAYDLYDTSQRQRLQNCASDPDKDFFVVNSGKDVADAFASITASIQQQVYLSK